MGSIPIERKILNSLKKAGYPLEIKTTKILMNRVMPFKNQKSYIDSETKKIRTIDIVTEFSKQEKKTNNLIKIVLAIECKKSLHPWVFFGFRNLGYQVFSRLNRDEYTLNSMFSKHKTSQEFGNHYAYDEYPLCISGIQVPFNDNQIQKEEVAKFSITDASNQISKGAYDIFLSNQKNAEKLFKENKIESYINIYPVIVFEGDLFVTESPEQESDIVRVDWLSYKFPLTFETTGNHKFLHIDIVNEKFFIKYLDLIEQEFEETHTDNVGYKLAQDKKEDFYVYRKGTDYRQLDKIFEHN